MPDNYIDMLCRRKGITKKELSELSGVHEGDIDSFRAGRGSIALFRLKKIAGVLGVRTSALIDDKCFAEDVAKIPLKIDDIPQGRILSLALRGIEEEINDYCERTSRNRSWSLVSVNELRALIEEKQAMHETIEEEMWKCV